MTLVFAVPLLGIIGIVLLRGISKRLDLIAIKLESINDTLGAADDSIAADLTRIEGHLESRRP